MHPFKFYYASVRLDHIWKIVCNKRIYVFGKKSEIPLNFVSLNVLFGQVMVKSSLFPWSCVIRAIMLSIHFPFYFFLGLTNMFGEIGLFWSSSLCYLWSLGVQSPINSFNFLDDKFSLPILYVCQKVFARWRQAFATRISQNSTVKDHYVFARSLCYRPFFFISSNALSFSSFP